MIQLMQNTRVRFIKEPHSYILDGVKKLKGVTSLMKEHNLSPNYKGAKEEDVETAKKRGSKVHQDIEDYCNGKAVAITKELKAYIGCGVKAIANEYLVSDNEIVASSIDIVADAGDGKVNLIDIKTTSTLHTNALSWQLSIYAYLFSLQNPDIKINKLYGLHIPKAGKAKMVEIAPIEQSQVLELLRCEKEWLPFVPKTEELSITQKNALSELRGITDSIALIKLSLKEAEEKKKSVEKYILEQMELEGRKTLENGPIKVTYVAESIRETVDKAKLEADMPELYERYKKVTTIAPSLRVTVKKQ